MNILVIDDDKQCVDSLTSALRLAGFDAVGYETPALAIAAFDPRTIDAVITDFHLPGIKGDEVVKRIHALDKNTPVIIITGYPDKKLERLSMKAGAHTFFRKPLDIEKIIDTLTQLSAPPPQNRFK